MITGEIVQRLVNACQYGDKEVQQISETVLKLAQNFDKKYPELNNLKKHHFKLINQFL